MAWWKCKGFSVLLSLGITSSLSENLSCCLPSGHMGTNRIYISFLLPGRSWCSGCRQKSERRLLEERETIPYPGFWPSSNSLVCNSPTPMMSQGLQCLEEIQRSCAGSSIQSRSLTSLIFVQYQTTDGLTETFEIISSPREKFKNWSTDKDKAKQSHSVVSDFLRTHGL